jgi:hypothetical protein
LKRRERLVDILHECIACADSHRPDAVAKDVHEAVRRSFDLSTLASRYADEGKDILVLMLPAAEQQETCLGREVGIFIRTSIVDDKHAERMPSGAMGVGSRLPSHDTPSSTIPKRSANLSKSK